ncbi:c-type cytochrome [Duganella sp. P38]|uniref:c-type cytochrome n=1 Tax=Duganella sp. P38 TaxID=3423949 RepID=UPI003D7B3FA8
MFAQAAAAALAILFLAGTAQAQVSRQIAQGQRIWQQRCTECHALDTEETGPRHRGVFGRRAGSIKGYDYSRALRKADVQWDAEALDRWLSDPEQFIPGQNMDYRVRSKAERAALIAYLRSLSPPPGR